MRQLWGGKFCLSGIDRASPSGFHFACSSKCYLRLNFFDRPWCLLSLCVYALISGDHFLSLLEGPAPDTAGLCAAITIQRSTSWCQTLTKCAAKPLSCSLYSYSWLWARFQQCDRQLCRLSKEQFQSSQRSHLGEIPSEMNSDLFVFVTGRNKWFQ